MARAARFFLAGRNKNVELLYAYIGITTLRINQISNHPRETDVLRIKKIQEELKIAASLPFTTAVTKKITDLATLLEVLKTGLRPVINWLEGIEQDGSFECGLAVAGNIALLERTTKAGLVHVGNFIEICRINPNAYGGIGYSGEVGFPALVQACSLGLGDNVSIENLTWREKAFVGEKSTAGREKLCSSRISNDPSKKPAVKCTKKRKLRQTSLLQLFHAPSKKGRHDHIDNM